MKFMDLLWQVINNYFPKIQNICLCITLKKNLLIDAGIIKTIIIIMIMITIMIIIIIIKLIVIIIKTIFIE